MSLSSLRDIVELVSGVTPNQQKLLHKGRILKGEDSSLQALGGYLSLLLSMCVCVCVCVCMCMACD